MSDYKVPTVRVASDTTEGGFVLINVVEFDHNEHLLFDDADAGMVPPPKEAAPEVSSDVTDLRAQISDLEDQVLEALSERDEWKARAEAAEAALSSRSAPNPDAPPSEATPAIAPKPRGKPGPKAK